MRPSALAAGAILVITLAATAAGEDLSLADQVQRSKTTDAALRCALQTIEQLGHRMSSEQEISKALLDDPVAHRERTTSRQKVIMEERERLRREVRRQLEQYGVDHDSMLGVEWAADTMRERHDEIESRIDGLIESQLSERYASARVLSVSRQRVALAGKLQPTASEVEAVAGAFDELSRASDHQVEQIVETRGQLTIQHYVKEADEKTPLLEEIQTELSSRVEEELLEGLKDLRRQLHLAMRYEGGDAVQASNIERNILDDLTGLSQGRRFGLFPAARAASSRRASQLEGDRLRRLIGQQLNEAAGCRALTPDRVIAEISTSYKQAPVDRKRHAEALIQALRREITEGISAVHASHVQEGNERTQFLTTIQAYLSGGRSPETADALERGIADCLEEPLRHARQRLAELKLEAKHPTIASKEFVFGEQDLKLIALGRTSRSEGIMREVQLHLSETRALFEQRWRALLEEAGSLVHLQEGMVRDPQRKRRYRAEIADEEDRSEAKRQQYGQRYAEEVLSDFRDRRPALLLNTESTKYDVVFATSLEIIDEIITTEWQTVAKQDERESTQVVLVTTRQPSPSSSTVSTNTAPQQTRSSEQREGTTQREGWFQIGNWGLLDFLAGLLAKLLSFLGSVPQLFNFSWPTLCPPAAALRPACENQLAQCLDFIENCSSNDASCASAASLCQAARRACGHTT